MKRLRIKKKENGKLCRRLSVFILSLAAAVVLAACLIPAIVSSSHVTVANKFAGDGFAVVGDRISERMDGKISNPAAVAEIFRFTADCSLYRKGNDYYIKKSGRGSDQKLNPDYPVFLNDGTYLYLYHDRFQPVTNRFEILKGRKDITLSNGMMFNRENKRDGDKAILMLKLPNGLFMNTGEMLLETGNSSVTIPMHSVLKLSEDKLSYCIIRENALEFQETAVTNSLAMISCAGERMSYSSLYEKLIPEGDGIMEGKTDGEAVAYPVDAPLYQYFMGQRYEYNSKKTFYRTRDGYLMETGGERFLIYQTPFYFRDEKKILLPCDYVLVQPKLFQMNKLPALSQVSVDENAVYTTTSGKMKTYTDLFLYDGSDNYIFFDHTVLSWDAVSIKVSPMSHVTAEKDGTVGVFDYEAGEHQLYHVDNLQNVNAKMENGLKINLYTDVLNRNDGQEQILFSQPSLLEEAE
jgi:hypothetical protein